MLRVVVTRIAKSQLLDSCSGLRAWFGIGYFPRIGVHKIRKFASLSATSIGTEENSLRVPKAQSRALIYTGVAKHDQHK